MWNGIGGWSRVGGAAAATLALLATGGCRSADDGGARAGGTRVHASLIGAPFVVAGHPSTERAGFLRAASGAVFAPSFQRDASGTVRGVVFYSDGHTVSAWDPTGATVWQLTIENLGVVPSIDWD